MKSILRFIGKYALIFVLVGWALKLFVPIFRHDNSMENQLYAYHNLEWLQNAFAYSAIAVSSYFWYLYAKKKKRGFVIGWLLLGLYLTIAFFEQVVSLQNISLTREWYINSRLDRGFPISPERAEAVITYQNGIIAVVGTIIFFGVIAFFLYRKRSHFSEV